MDGCCLTPHPTHLQKLLLQATPLLKPNIRLGAAGMKETQSTTKTAATNPQSTSNIKLPVPASAHRPNAAHHSTQSAHHSTQQRIGNHLINHPNQSHFLYHPHLISHLISLIILLLTPHITTKSCSSPQPLTALLSMAEQFGPDNGTTGGYAEEAEGKTEPVTTTTKSDTTSKSQIKLWNVRGFLDNSNLPRNIIDYMNLYRYNNSL